MFTKWVAMARKPGLTIAFCVIFRGASHGDVHFGQNPYFWTVLKNYDFYDFCYFCDFSMGLGVSNGPGPGPGPARAVRIFNFVPSLISRFRDDA